MEDGDIRAKMAALKATAVELHAARRQLYERAQENDDAIAALKDAHNKRRMKERAARVLAHLGDDEFAGVRAELASAGVAVAVECIGWTKGEVFTVSFARGDACICMRIGFLRFNDRPLPGTIAIGHGAGPAGCNTPCDLLSVLDQTYWRNHADGVGMPPTLCRVDVATEFVAALVAPLFTKASFEAHFGRVLATYDAGGATCYAAGGGRRAVMFACKWAASDDTHFANVYE